MSTIVLSTNPIPELKTIWNFALKNFWINRMEMKKNRKNYCEWHFWLKKTDARMLVRELSITSKKKLDLFVDITHDECVIYFHARWLFLWVYDMTFTKLSGKSTKIYGRTWVVFECVHVRVSVYQKKKVKGLLEILLFYRIASHSILCFNFKLIKFGIKLLRFFFCWIKSNFIWNYICVEGKERARDSAHVSQKYDCVRNRIRVPCVISRGVHCTIALWIFDKQMMQANSDE